MSPRRLADPVRDELTRELRAIRRGQGDVALRLGATPWIADSLGRGSVEQAATELSVIRNDHGSDPTTGVGAFFWLAEYGARHPGSSLEQRTEAYAQKFNCDPRTALRRSDSGIETLVGRMRDHVEAHRPVGIISMFQSGPLATVIVDFSRDYEATRLPVVYINGEAQSLPEMVWHHEDNDNRYTARLIFDELPLDVDVGPYDRALHALIIWEMPIAPVWWLNGWVADPRFMMRLQTFHGRRASVSIAPRPDGQNKFHTAPPV